MNRSIDQIIYVSTRYLFVPVDVLNDCFNCKIPCISSAAKETNMTFFGDTMAHAKFHGSRVDLQFSLFC
jgi:hypothetical protein